MASTYVNDLRLNEMATGDASGSWGTVTNTNLELIGEAFSYGTETIGDADSTLTIADGAADAARSFYLKITSSVDLTTTRIVTLAPNTVSKVWMIENATTGSQVITIKQGSGATINVPNGQVKMISTDGAGSGGAVLDLLVDVDLTGTTTLVNLDVSGTLGVTGVLTATSLDISGDIDVDGTTNLDVVDIDGATQIDATVTVGVDDTGYDVKFFGATAGAYMLWDESADDLILGGAAGLSVNSTALVTGVLTTTAATVSNGGGQFNGAINVGVDDTGYDVKFFGATAGKYMLWDESADTLEVSGTVTADGLGVSGLVTLDDYSGNSGRGRINIGNSGQQYIEGYDSGNAGSGSYLSFGQGASERLRIDNAGNVGIGTSTPATALSIVRSYTGGSDTGYPHIYLNNTAAQGNGSTTFNQAMLRVNAGDGAVGFLRATYDSAGPYGTSIDLWSVSNIPLRFATNNTERMRIDASGNLLVGHTSQDFPVDDGGAGVTLRPTGVMLIGGTGTSIYANREDSDGEIVQFRKDGTTVGSIGVAGGDLYISGGSSHAGIRFDTNVLTPAVNGTQTDATVDLGYSTQRFKDLYLSGGVYLGGTVAANYLDDYEEGTWTVVNRSIASLTITNDGQARYVKIGGLVFIHVYITYPSTADTNQAKINLPFVCTGYGMLTGRLANSAKSGTTGFVMQTLDSTDESVFYPITSASNAYINSELDGSFLLLSGCYQTSA
jgi:hypothetical protein